MEVLVLRELKNLTACYVTYSVYSKLQRFQCMCNKTMHIQKN